ncbi:MAG: response regulator [Anaerolineales bacterium]|nr:response regulator [Anaerolineales bacterium]
MTEKILIVDDDFDTLRLVGLMLERQGYSIVAAENGQQALQALGKEKPDLVLLDVMMPGMDGYEVARRIRKDSELGNIPIIMFTAKTQVEDKVTGLESGVDVYLTKPTQPRELFAQVKVLLTRAKKTITTPLPKETQRGYMIGVIAAKGGVGVSSLAINLGITLYRMTNNESLVVDFHPGSGDISWNLGYSSQGGLNRLLELESHTMTPEIIENEIIIHDSGVRLLLASQSPKEAVQLTEVAKLKTIASRLPFIAKWIVLDLGSYLLPATQSLIKLCDEVLIAVEPTPTNVKQTKALIDDLASLGISEGRLRIVLINRIRSSVQLNMKQVENDIGLKITTVFTPAPELAFQASISNMPMVFQQAGSITAQQYEKLAATISQHILH